MSTKRGKRMKGNKNTGHKNNYMDYLSGKKWVK